MSQTPVDRESILELLRAAEAADGFSALNDAASLRLRHGAAGTETVLRAEGGLVIAYGQRDPGPGGVAEASLVVHPDHRRRGLGTAVLAELLARGPLEIWAVRATPAALALAARAGLRAVRELLIMRRPLTAPVAPVPPPAGVQIRTFRPGVDEAPWLGVNARAFAHHPEQGGLTLADLQQRMAEPWFDPEGFFLATVAGRVIGFHWTKQHPDQLGEVYVLGVDPEAGVRGVGRALLAAGLSWLRSTGDEAVLLYVDGTNVRAVALYEGAGFTVASRDVMYASLIPPGAPLATMQ